LEKSLWFQVGWLKVFVGRILLEVERSSSTKINMGREERFPI